jgi:hypothetical protein
MAAARNVNQECRTSLGGIVTDDPAGGPPRQKKDTTEYSASKAPETRKEAEEPPEFSDTRLKPGGATGSPVDVGMSSLQRDETPHGGQSAGQQRYGDTSDVGAKGNTD